MRERERKTVYPKLNRMEKEKIVYRIEPRRRLEENCIDGRFGTLGKRLKIVDRQRKENLRQEDMRRKMPTKRLEKPIGKKREAESGQNSWKGGGKEHVFFPPDLPFCLGFRT